MRGRHDHFREVLVWPAECDIVMMEIVWRAGRDQIDLAGLDHLLQVIPVACRNRLQAQAQLFAQMGEIVRGQSVEAAFTVHEAVRVPIHLESHPQRRQRAQAFQFPGAQRGVGRGAVFGGIAKAPAIAQPGQFRFVDAGGGLVQQRGQGSRIDPHCGRERQGRQARRSGQVEIIGPATGQQRPGAGRGDADVGVGFATGQAVQALQAGIAVLQHRVRIGALQAHDGVLEAALDENPRPIQIPLIARARVIATGDQHGSGAQVGPQQADVALVATGMGQREQQIERRCPPGGARRDGLPVGEWMEGDLQAGARCKQADVVDAQSFRLASHPGFQRHVIAREYAHAQHRMGATPGDFLLVQRQRRMRGRMGDHDQ